MFAAAGGLLELNACGMVHQVGLPGEWLKHDLSVVLECPEEVREHVSVCFVVREGNGTLSRHLVPVGREGRASTRWMLDAHSGEGPQQVMAYVLDRRTMDVLSDTVVFTAKMADENLLTLPQSFAESPDISLSSMPDVLSRCSRVVNVSEVQPTILVRTPCRTLVSIVQYTQSLFIPRQAEISIVRIFSLRE